MPVQDVYKFTAEGDNRRIVAGTVESGTVRAGDEIVFHPSGKRARVKTLESFGSESPDAFRAGDAVGFTLEEQIYVARGELCSRADQPAPRVSTRLRASLFWRRSPWSDREYLLKLGTARAAARSRPYTGARRDVARLQRCRAAPPRSR
jgi:bifunctional enzyme CysN/CysC